MPYRLFPYERRLGLRELDSLGASVVSSDADGVVVAGDTGLAVRRATYFETIASSAGGWKSTDQAAVEAAHFALRGGRRVRQATRYGLHGIHEYKGKFNPQVVRALCNIVDAEAEVLIDPFCGSGTALLEGLRLGMDVVGVDHSPMACFLADTKLAATTAESSSALAENLLNLGHRCAQALERGQASEGQSRTTAGLDEAAATYLRHWFTPPAWAAIGEGLDLLRGSHDSVARRLALIALSSVMRQVSLQLPEDLRVRRRPDPFVAPPIAPLFLDAVHAVRRGLLETGEWAPTASRWTVCRASAESSPAYRTVREGRRLIFTSPPYATALPYIDTDRLSMVALGLAHSADLLTLERSLIGSREWTRREAAHWEERRRANADCLPRSVIEVVCAIQRANQDSAAGFRRQAVPSLLYRYFARMGIALARWYDALSADEFAILIVGRNHTHAGGQRVDIATPELLGDIAEARGFDVNEFIKLETWPRYGLHAANGVPGEDALVLRHSG